MSVEATGHEYIHHEAEVEHEGAKRLIAVKTVRRVFRCTRVGAIGNDWHHVKEEEKAAGMFTKARKSDMDLAEIGEQLQARKSELEADSASLGTTKKLFAAA